MDKEILKTYADEAYINNDAHSLHMQKYYLEREYKKSQGEEADVLKEVEEYVSQKLADVLGNNGE